MNLISSENINNPKIKVSPPAWIIILSYVILGLVILMLLNLPIENTLLKSAIVFGVGIVIFGVVRNQFKGNNMVTMIANNGGIYFQTSDVNLYFHVPWENIVKIEKVLFPVNRRGKGLRFEVSGEYDGKSEESGHIGNVKIEGDKTFIYTIPQLHNRDQLITQFYNLKKKLNSDGEK